MYAQDFVERKSALDLVGEGGAVAFDSRISAQGAWRRIANAFFNAITRVLVQDLCLRTAVAIDVQHRIPAMETQDKVGLEFFDPTRESLVLWLAVGS